MKRLLALLLLSAFTVFAADVDAGFLRGKVMCGYQGWFRCPDECRQAALPRRWRRLVDQGITVEGRFITPHAAFLCVRRNAESRSQDMNPPQKPSQPPTANPSDTGKLPKKEKDSHKPDDFPSGDEGDREGGDAGPEEKRKP